MEFWNNVGPVDGVDLASEIRDGRLVEGKDAHRGWLFRKAL
jgi:hypothetical protein